MGPQLGVGVLETVGIRGSGEQGYPLAPTKHMLAETGLSMVLANEREWVCGGQVGELGLQRRYMRRTGFFLPFPQTCQPFISPLFLPLLILGAR